MKLSVFSIALPTLLSLSATNAQAQVHHELLRGRELRFRDGTGNERHAGSGSQGPFGKGGRGSGGLFGRTSESGECYWSGVNGDSEPLLTRIVDECGTYTCTEEDIDCTAWDTVTDEDLIRGYCDPNMTQEERDASRLVRREKWLAMTTAERQDFLSELKDVNEANKHTVLECACCNSDGIDSIVGLVAGKEGAVAKALGLRRVAEAGRLGSGEGFRHGHGDN